MEQNENLYRSGGVHGKGTVYVIVFTWWCKCGAAGKETTYQSNSQGWLQYSWALASLPVAPSVYWIQCHSMGGILLWASRALGWFFGSPHHGCGFLVCFFMCLGATLVVVSNLLKKKSMKWFPAGLCDQEVFCSSWSSVLVKAITQDPSFVGTWKSLDSFLDFFSSPIQCI